jgi:hypothetical protein
MKIRVLGIDDAIAFMGTTSSDLVEATADLVQRSAQKHTPIKSGRARRSWNKKVSSSTATSGQGFRVENKVPYIGRLEEGYSKQAPKGIIGPTLRDLKRGRK